MSKLFSGDETNYRLHLHDDKWYYKSQLNKLNSNSQTFSIVITDFEGNVTKSLGLNKDSIEVLKAFLEMINKG